MNAIINVLAEGESAVTYPFPTVVFGIIAISTFIVLGLITWSYRDVANRHDHKTGNSKNHH